MSTAEALKIVRECGEYWNYQPSKWAEGLEHSVTLDGTFSAEDLEAFVILLRNKVSPREK